MKKLTDKMVKELNNELKNGGTCLQYEVIKGSENEVCTNYRLVIIDKFITKSDISYSIPNATKDFENFVRNYFLKKYNVENTGFSNSVITLVVFKEE